MISAEICQLCRIRRAKFICEQPKQRIVINWKKPWFFQRQKISCHARICYNCSRGLRKICPVCKNLLPETKKLVIIPEVKNRMALLTNPCSVCGINKATVKCQQKDKREISEEIKKPYFSVIRTRTRVEYLECNQLLCNDCLRSCPNCKMILCEKHYSDNFSGYCSQYCYQEREYWDPT